MARWTEARLFLALIVAGLLQAPPPGTTADGPLFSRAVLLEAGDLYTRPSSDGEMVQRLAAGTVLQYIGEVTDAFGRTWNVVRDPGRLERSSSTYLGAFDVGDLPRFRYRAALLANRSALNLPAGAAGPVAAAGERGAAAPTGSPVASSPDWWRSVAIVEPSDQVTFDDIVAVSAVAASESELREAIDLLGGREAIAVWPSNPTPGELFIPEMLPALYQYDGQGWELARPVRFLGDGVNVLGNSRFAVDRDAPPLAGGPALHCWSLRNALDERGEPAGAVSVAPPPPAARRGQAAPVDMGMFDPAAAPPILQGLLPPAPEATRVPPRIDPPAGLSGVLLADNDGQQAVYLEQRLGRTLTQRLRGRSVVVDVTARDDPRAGAATFGINVDVLFADGRPPQPFAGPYTSREAALRYELAFEVPADADDLIVRLLPLDRTLAVEQQGSVIFERAGLRLASWQPQPQPATIVLNRVVVSSFEGARLYTRAPVAPTFRNEDEVERIWPTLARSAWSVEDRQHLLAGTLRTGMDREQVAVAWGRPSAENALSGGEGVEWLWDRDDRYVVFINGFVAVFRQPAEEEAAVGQPMCPAAIGAPADSDSGHSGH